MKTLKDLQVGEAGVIGRVRTTGALKQRFMDMGITKGTEVKIIKIAPLGDPIEVEIRGYTLSIRKEDAEKIELGGKEA